MKTLTGRSTNFDALDTCLNILSNLILLVFGVALCFGVILAWVMATATEPLRWKNRSPHAH